MGIPDLTDCSNQRYMAGAAGAATALTGLDLTFTGLGAPPIVHWALAGAATDVYCRGTIGELDSQLVMCAMWWDDLSQCNKTHAIHSNQKLEYPSVHCKWN